MFRLVVSGTWFLTTGKKKKSLAFLAGYPSEYDFEEVVDDAAASRRKVPTTISVTCVDEPQVITNLLRGSPRSNAHRSTFPFL